jgi:hypothetical protein
MTKTFDFSTTDILDHNFSFSKMTEEEIAEKKKELEAYQKEKAKPELPEVGKKPEAAKKPVAKPIFKPRIPKKK